MIDIKRIYKDKDQLKSLLLKRDIDIDFDEIINLNEEKKKIIYNIDQYRSIKNNKSKEYYILSKSNDVNALKQLSSDIKKIDENIIYNENQLSILDNKLYNLLIRIPNIPDEDLKAGGKENNEVIRIIGNKPKFDFEIKNHVDLCKTLGIIDYQRGAKLSGNGFWIYKGDGARLEMALINFFIDEHINNGYEFILPPHQLNYKCGIGAGQFPKFEDEVYFIDYSNDKNINRFLLPTAETALANLYSDEVIEQDILPIKLCAYTPCYRKEAGGYRAEERGIIRGHQFNKVEMFQYTLPENSMQAFDELVNNACNILNKLNLHYQVSKLAAGDCSESMCRTTDIEVWIPSMGIYKEVSSVSNAKDYQTRRNNTKFRRKSTNKLEYVHTLNGSGLATPRVFAAIIEQFQNKDGTITIPEVLRKYMNGQTLLKNK